MRSILQRVWLVGTFAVCALLGQPLMAAPTTQPLVSSLVPSHVNRFIDVRYGNGPGKSNLLDVYLPDHVEPGQVYPLVVWIHGGAWLAGDKQGLPQVPMLSHGFVVVSINYRLSQQSVFPAQIQDCKGAIRFLRAHARQYHIDPNKVGVWGASAGGHLAALLGTSGGSTELEGNVGRNLDQSSRVQAVCDWFGPTDLTQFTDQARAAGISKTTPGAAPIVQLFGGNLQDKKDLLRLANPIWFVSKKSASALPPFLIMHGDKDKMVPVAQSQILADALKKISASVDMRVISGAGHGNGFATSAVGNTVLDFFESKLKSK
jgi:acetyl esterase/lipase